MPEEGIRRKERGQGAAYPLPIAVRRRLWDAIWERLLVPAPSESPQGCGADKAHGDGDRQPRTPAGARRDGEAA